jgi:predicted enzyme related to lactoylglutathione lyase
MYCSFMFSTFFISRKEFIFLYRMFNKTTKIIGLTKEVNKIKEVFMGMTSIKEPIIKTIGGAGLHVNHLEEMVRWYGQLLDMPTNSYDRNNPFYLFDMDNRVNLMLDDHRNMQGETNHPICQMKTSDIDRAYELVKESQIPILREIERPHPGLSYFNIEDSEGNGLMIVESDWENPNPIKQMDPNHPINNHLEAIVIPVKNLNRATEWYSKLLGYPIKPDRQDGGPIYWFEMEKGTGILLDDNRNNQDLDSFPTFMLKATNIHEAYETVKKMGIEIVREIQFDHYFLIKDLEGNTMMICL